MKTGVLCGLFRRKRKNWSLESCSSGTVVSKVLNLLTGVLRFPYVWSVSPGVIYIWKIPRIFLQLKRYQGFTTNCSSPQLFIPTFGSPCGLTLALFLSLTITKSILDCIYPGGSLRDLTSFFVKVSSIFFR